MKRLNPQLQRGISLSGLIFTIAVLCMIALLAVKIFPAYAEYRAIKDAIVAAKATNGSPRDMQISFDKAADINNIKSISGKDLVIGKENDETEISFSYESRIPLFGNASLLLDFEGTTAKSGVMPAKPE